MGDFMTSYNANYLYDARIHLGTCFDYLINTCGFEPDKAMNIFIESGIALLFGEGNPGYVSGMSGVELARHIYFETFQEELSTGYTPSLDRSPQYWAGYSLASYQWKSGKSFKKICQAVPFNEVVGMYSVYHEMDTREFEDEMDRRVMLFMVEARKSSRDNVLKRLRAYAGMSQSQLAKASSVKLRSIQMYEQGVYNLRQAEAGTVFRLARALNTTVEELLQDDKSGD